MLSKETLDAYRNMTPGERLELSLRMTQESIPALLEGPPALVALRLEMLARENDERNKNILAALARLRPRS
ncbi:MAG: hypothetical protein ACKO9B_07600 [Planctomycetota bacterium]